MRIEINLDQIWSDEDETTLRDVIRTEVVAEVRRQARTMARDLLSTDAEFREAVSSAHTEATAMARKVVNDGLKALFG